MDVSIERLNLLHPKIREDANKAYLEAILETPMGCHPFITQTMRTFEESNHLYAQGRTEPGAKVTNAKAGQSMHNYFLAIDFCLIVNGVTKWEVTKNWMIVVNCFKKYGFSWGGDWKGKFKDYPHLEKTFGYSWQDLLAKYKANDYITGTKYLNL